MPQLPPNRLRRSAIALLMLVAGSVVFDLLTPVSIEPVLLYLPAVILAAWRFGVVAAFFVSLAGAIVRMIGDPEAISIAVGWEACSWFAACFVLGLLTALLRRSIDRERRSARTDRLTGLANRMAMMERIEAELNRGRREGIPLSVAYIDCDDFKQVNDRQGHAVGDRVLQAIAAAMKRGTRNYDLVARPGGDEFVVVLPNTTDNDAGAVIERIRQQLTDVMRDNGWQVTCSIGVASFDELPKSADEVIGAADKLMYGAKQSGKNEVRIESYGQDSLTDAP